MIGCLAVLGLFGLFAYVGLRIVRRSADPFVRLAAGGATIWLCGQAVINIGYVTGMLPVTGIPLPLISAGGTSLLVTMFVIGMLVSFARHESAAVTAARRAERRGRRSRVERWLRIPVPSAYVPPKRRRRPTRR
jgi:cell division protein FtsW